MFFTPTFISSFFFFWNLATVSCSFPALDNIHSQISALVIKSFLGAALKADIILLFEFHLKVSALGSTGKPELQQRFMVYTATTWLLQAGANLAVSWLVSLQSYVKKRARIYKNDNSLFFFKNELYWP